jgi:hypothetical protein
MNLKRHYKQTLSYSSESWTVRTREDKIDIIRNAFDKDC